MKSGIFLRGDIERHGEIVQNQSTILYITSNYIFYLWLNILIFPPLYLVWVLIQLVSSDRPSLEAFALNWTFIEAFGSGSILGTLCLVYAAVTFTRTIRVSFNKNTDLFTWDKLTPDTSDVRQMPLSIAEAIIIPKQRLLLPKPAYIQFLSEDLPLEQRRPWRGDMAQIRKLAEFSGLPLIDKEKKAVRGDASHSATDGEGREI